MNKRGAGGTSGRPGSFFIGLPMVLIGGWLFINQVMVTTSFRTLWDGNGSGIALLLLFGGIGILFFSGKSWLGWLLVAIAAIMIFLNIISNLVVYFRPASLASTILMFGLLFGGMGLVARSLRPIQQ